MLIVLTGYCAAIMAASVGGGWLPSIFRLTHTRMQTTISFVGGLMLGIAVFHLLPHSVHGNNSIDDSVWWMMAGILTMFLLIRCFHFHHHGPLEISTAQEDPCAGHEPHDHDHDDRHGNGHVHARECIADRRTAVLSSRASVELAGDCDWTVAAYPDRRNRTGCEC